MASRSKKELPPKAESIYKIYKISLACEQENYFTYILMRKCFSVSFRFFAFFSQSKTGYAEQKICLSSPAGQKPSTSDDTVRRHGFAHLPSEDKLFFHPHIPQKCFLRYAKNKNKKHNK